MNSLQMISKALLSHAMCWSFLTIQWWLWVLGLWKVCWPLQGSFLTRNSSKAVQPPPTLTINVLRRIRTIRSCWESPNWSKQTKLHICKLQLWGHSYTIRAEGTVIIVLKVSRCHALFMFFCVRPLLLLYAAQRTRTRYQVIKAVIENAAPTFVEFVSIKKDSLCICWHLFAPPGTSWDSCTVTPADSPEEGK